MHLDKFVFNGAGEHRYFDPTGTGSVKKEDFAAGLAALVATAEVPFSVSNNLFRALNNLFTP